MQPTNPSLPFDFSRLSYFQKHVGGIVLKMYFFQWQDIGNTLQGKGGIMARRKFFFSFSFLDGEKQFLEVPREGYIKAYIFKDKILETHNKERGYYGPWNMRSSFFLFFFF